jgi:nucleoside-diphosphate-sugar epimerase
MPAQETVLLVGGTGRTGRRVLKELLRHGIKVRVIVRSAQRLPEVAGNNPNLTIAVADLLSMGRDELMNHLRGCDAVISCLGHVPSFKGLYGAPRDLVTRATTLLCKAIEDLQPAKPVGFILLSSVSVNHPEGLDTRRGIFEKAFIWMIRGLLPPAKDNQQAANFLHHDIGTTHPFLQWTVVRPDKFLGGDPSEYTVHEEIVDSLFAPGASAMANIAHFMGELVTNPAAWNDWKGKFPVLVNATPTSSPQNRPDTVEIS